MRATTAGTGRVSAVGLSFTDYEQNSTAVDELEANRFVRARTMNKRRSLTVRDLAVMNTDFVGTQVRIEGEVPTVTDP